MAKRQARGRSQRGSSKRKTGGGTARSSRPAAKRRAPARKAGAATKARKSPKKAQKVARAKTVVRAKNKSATSKTRKVAPKRSKAAATKPNAAPVKAARLERTRRTLDETVQTPPSSLDMVRRGTAARTGRAEMAEHLRDQHGMSPVIAAGDRDVNVEDAYFTGDESPGGDNTTPDQDVVDEIGKALGVEYQDDEELKSVDKVEKRDRERWELDPASSEDYKDRDRG